MTLCVIGGKDPFHVALTAQLEAGGADLCEWDQAEGAPAAEAVVFAAASAFDGLAPDGIVSQAVLSTLARANHAQVVVLSASAVHRPRHSHPGLVGEVAPSGRSPLTDPWRDLERRAEAAFEGKATRLTILRPAPVPVRGGRAFFSRLFSRKYALTLPGHDPSIQLLAMEDLAGAISAVLKAGTSGLFNVAPRHAAPLRKALAQAGVRNLKVPRLLQKAARALLRPVFGCSPSAFLQQLRYCFTVDGARLQQVTGFRPAFSTLQTAALFAGKNVASVDETGFDDHGWERPYTDRLRATLFGFLHNWFWRVEHTGVDFIPKHGRALAIGVHRGFMPFDGTMALYEMVAKIGRYPRTLIHPCLVKPAFQADYIRRIGGVVAGSENADRLLGDEELVALFPEGINGAFTFYRDAYKLGNFGRDAYIKIALRNQAPIIPFVTVGSAEIFPIFGRIKIGWLQRYTEWPFLPITTPFPLPSKWHTRYLEPIPIAGRYSPEDAADPAVVAEISRLVRGRMEQAISDMLARRKSIFFGNLWDDSPIETAPSSPNL